MATKADRDAQRTLDVGKAVARTPNEDQTKAAVAEAAQAIATQYFRYEADPNSSKGYIFENNLLFDDPELVPGWPNRWRVHGTVGVQYLTRNIGAVGRELKDFEVLVDAPPGSKPKRVDITVKF